MIMQAAAFAAEAHAQQKRKTGNVPYVNHLLRVADMAARAGLPAEAIAAAVLHDSVEDTWVTRKDLEERFPSRVVELVHLMTQWWDDHAPQDLKAREKPKYYAAILKDEDAINIKLLDRADNLNDMTRMLPTARSWAEKYLRRSFDETGPLYEASQNEECRKIYQKAIEDLKAALARKR